MPSCGQLQHRFQPLVLAVRECQCEYITIYPAFKCAEGLIVTGACDITEEVSFDGDQDSRIAATQEQRLARNPALTRNLSALYQ